eukprot:4439595-Prymnesium_polylepis.2
MALLCRARNQQNGIRQSISRVWIVGAVWGGIGWFAEPLPWGLGWAIGTLADVASWSRSVGRQRQRRAGRVGG